LSGKTCIAIEEWIEAEQLGDLELKGISKPVLVYDLKSRRSSGQ
jgi:class 3 adenylate cyclase